MNKIIILLLIFCTNIITSAQAKITKNSKILPADKLYNKAILEIHKTNYGQAIKISRQIIMLYPFSNLANKSDINIAFAYYKLKDYDNSINIMDHYIHLYPLHKNIIYAHYLKSVAQYHKLLLENNNLETIQKTLNGFIIITESFPNSTYSKSAEEYKKATTIIYKKHIFNIGLFYFKKNNYNAAASRLLSIIDEGPTKINIQALHYLAISYKKLNNEQESQKFYNKILKIKEENT